MMRRELTTCGRDVSDANDDTQSEKNVCNDHPCDRHSSSFERWVTLYLAECNMPEDKSENPGNEPNTRNEVAKSHHQGRYCESARSSLPEWGGHRPRWIVGTRMDGRLGRLRGLQRWRELRRKQG